MLAHTNIHYVFNLIISFKLDGLVPNLSLSFSLYLFLFLSFFIISTKYQASDWKLLVYVISALKRDRFCFFFLSKVDIILEGLNETTLVKILKRYNPKAHFLKLCPDSSVDYSWL